MYVMYICSSSKCAKRRSPPSLLLLRGVGVSDMRDEMRGGGGGGGGGGVDIASGAALQF